MASKAAASRGPKRSARVAVSAPGAEEPRDIVINIAKDGTMSVAGKPVTREDLKPRLVVACRANREQSVILLRHAESSDESHAQLLALVKDSGIWKISSATMPSSPEN